MMLSVFKKFPVIATMPERSKDWIRQAERDLEMAKSAMKEGFYEWSCFVAQQAAEKAIKAVFQKMGSIAMGHSTLDLLRALARRKEIPGELIEDAKQLDKFYIPTRYPNGFDSGSPFEYFTMEDAKNAILYCERILRFCKDILSKEG